MNDLERALHAGSLSQLQLLLEIKLIFIENFKLKQDVFVKHLCPRNANLLRNTTLIFDLDLCR